MEADRSKWGDDRLDDAIRNIDRRLIGVEGVNTRLTAFETELGFVRADTEALRRAQEQRARDREQERRDREQERKEDRRALLWSIFTAAGLVIAALGLILDKL
jgi:hypothetical protein